MTNRILLVDGLKSKYVINFSEYFNFNTDEIVFDSDKINKICRENNNSIYPEILNNKLYECKSFDNLLTIFKKNNINCLINLQVIFERNEKIIIFMNCHNFTNNPEPYLFFKNLIFTNKIKKDFFEKYNLLKKPYLAIQIRNTDYKCDYIKLINENEEIINKYNEIFVATDDLEVLNYLKSKNINFKNFTTFPDKPYFNLHYSSINSDTKIKDTFSDVFLLAMSDKILSNSRGNYIKMARNCFTYKNDLIKQLEI
jgi:hypothetical protein